MLQLGILISCLKAMALSLTQLDRREIRRALHKAVESTVASRIWERVKRVQAGMRCQSRSSCPLPSTVMKTMKVQLISN